MLGQNAEASESTPRRCSTVRMLTLLMLPVMICHTGSNNWAEVLADQNTASQPSQSSQINKLIEQLGDSSFIQREAAKEELEKIGLLAFEDLRMAEMHPNVEIAHSATYLLHSMRVEWTLPTDSFEIHRLLKDYNDALPRSKLDYMQRLAKLHRRDGYLALLRLMRYENDEKLSKAAAVHVMEGVLSPKKISLLPSAQPLNWSELIVAGIGDSTRTSANWLKLLADQLKDQTHPVEPWQKFVTQERLLLESNAKSKDSQAKTDDQIVKQLYRVVVKLLLTQNKRAEAIAFFEPCLDLVAKDQSAAFHDVQWMLEEGLPEAVIMLSNQRPQLMAQKSRLRYLLAESYLKAGQPDMANRVAVEASDLTLTSLKSVPPNSRVDAEATQRHDNATFLLERGLYEWAESELVRIISTEPEKNNLSIYQETRARNALAILYWNADAPDKAAQAWQPLLQRAGLIDPDPKLPGDTDKDLLSELNQRSADDIIYIRYAPSRYYFYLGLAAIRSNDLAQARQYFLKALSIDGDDPDLLIAMHKAAGDDQKFTDTLLQAIDRLEGEYRSEMAKAESQLVNATTPNIRTGLEKIIAEQCNQLAWLLAGTERKTQEAVTLSQRSLMLEPDYAIFIDTLARCYYSAGQIDKAIETQTRALELMPFERPMARQLAEFKAAKAARKP